ncbi:uncharacterized protein [Pseudochaenichthys georgianus]|uniref:uncharacterized protein n=1 Tax=Pseudochaenichthys georgianus TaxID=52239 RepID=UPI00146DD7CE|nr:trihelix transcription factor GT-3a-like [Pseudochaenichthys georgianus]
MQWATVTNELFKNKMASHGTATAEASAGTGFVFKWSKEQTAQFIQLRGDNESLFTGAKFSAAIAWRTVLEDMGLQGSVTPLQAKKKWDNLKKRYKDCKYPGSGEGVGGKPTAATWPWFVQMDEILGQRPSICPPVLISSIPEDTPRPSSAVGDQEEDEEEDQVEAGPSRPKRKRNDGLMDLIREDMKQQREENRENLNRLFSLLEKFVDK